MSCKRDFGGGRICGGVQFIVEDTGNWTRYRCVRCGHEEITFRNERARKDYYDAKEATIRQCAIEAARVVQRKTRLRSDQGGIGMDKTELYDLFKKCLKDEG